MHNNQQEGGVDRATSNKAVADGEEAQTSPQEVIGMRKRRVKADGVRTREEDLHGSELDDFTLTIKFRLI